MQIAENLRTPRTATMGVVPVASQIVPVIGVTSINASLPIHLFVLIRGRVAQALFPARVIAPLESLREGASRDRLWITASEL